jgi:hypothetical protein
MATFDLDEEGLRSALDVWSWSTRSDAVNIATRSGPLGADLLADQLRKRHGGEYSILVAAFGDADPTTDDSYLLDIVRSRGETRDVRCAALVALSKRRGSAATTFLAESLGDSDRAIQRYAMKCLAYVGDGSAWNPAFDSLSSWFRRPSKLTDVDMPDEAVGLAYLLGHLDSYPESGNRLVELVLRNMSRLPRNSQNAIKDLWPEVQHAIPSQSVTYPNSDFVLRRVRDHLRHLFKRGVY